ncbi:DUF3221 domain-containing protein [Bacillus aerolatus]|uniref:DUF3221 domain-containing protein n=1 Tax=Bacillus aerolatus TaxID=2653354 RepID=A0A6I1FG72_9BACI|nr:DUF3221 domain-containing protein [Bacillus aerolatus]KAB7707174.1 DUF3221 domain-containing protein [Bacillus aerolatus]
MKKPIMMISIFFLSMILASCQMADGNKTNGSNNGQIQEEKWPALKTVSGRKIIAELEQTTTDTKIRNEAFAKVKESEELNRGLFGKNTPELREDLGVQWIEAEAAMQAIEKIFGGHGGVNDVGVIFSENQSSGADQPGFWLGIKEPDEKVTEFVEELQKQVDEGKILAKYIYIFQSEFTQSENNELMDRVSAAVKKMASSHATPDRVSYGVSVDTITGTVEISHDFLTDKQKEAIQKQFPDHTFSITQEGRLVAGLGEADIEYPKKKITRTLSKEGAYVMSVSESSMLVVEATPMDFSATGGESNFYSAVSYSFPKADEKVEVGQRVLVEASGPIMESYPGQGSAKYVEVLPTYQPEKADLTEAEVVRQAIKQSKKEGGFVLAVSHIAFDVKTDQWKVEFTQDQDVFEVVVDDKRGELSDN